MLRDLIIATTGALVGMCIWVGATLLIAEIAVKHIQRQ